MGGTFSVSWSAADGLRHYGALHGDSYEEQLSRLQSEREELRSKRNHFFGSLALLAILLVVFAFLTLNLEWLGDDLFFFFLILFYLGLFAFMLLLGGINSMSALADIQAEIRKAEANEGLQEFIDNKVLARAQRLFGVSSIELKRYHDQGLRQRTFVFLIGVFCIFAGFAVVVAALWIIAYRLAEAEIGTQILVASLGAVSGILANFIAVVFLRMFEGTIKSSIEFHTRLVETHHAHFANVLAAGISDPTLRDSTVSGVSLAVLGADGAKAATDGNAE